MNALTKELGYRKDVPLDHIDNGPTIRGTLKAWHIAADFTDYYGAHLLVFAETPGKAKTLAIKQCLYDYDGFEFIKCRRAKRFDGLKSSPTVVEMNDDLPGGFEFYSDSEGDEVSW